MLMFDSDDHRLVKAVNKIRMQDNESTEKWTLLQLGQHPRGIKELTAPQELRIACAVIGILDNLSSLQSRTRLLALNTLKNEVMANDSILPLNAARVLVQIMKEFIRAEGNDRRQLELARDFRQSLRGNPRTIRKELANYHLLEIQENATHIAFDDHVHDVSTKGRKTPSHLIMDAWIKGINELTVVYYNYVKQDSVEELLIAAKELDMQVRIAIEFSAKYYDGGINILWIPEKISNSENFREFLGREDIAKLMRDGEEASEYHEKLVLKYLNIFTNESIPQIEKDLGLTLPRPDPDEFTAFVGEGQASLIHLSEYITNLITPVLKEKERAIHAQGGKTSSIVKALDKFEPEYVGRKYIEPLKEKFHVFSRASIEGMPHILELSPEELISKLNATSYSCRLALSTSGLRDWEIPEIIYRCKGSISDLEIFNLKDFVLVPGYDTELVNKFRIALNNADIGKLKSILTSCIERVLDSNPDYCNQRLEALREVRANLSELTRHYDESNLSALVGSDSAGKSKQLYGMGLAVVDSLPATAEKQLRKTKLIGRTMLPVKAKITRTLKELENNSLFSRIPLVGRFFKKWKSSWSFNDKAAYVNCNGNIITLGGLASDPNDESTIFPAIRTPWYFWRYMNTPLKNTLKVLIGFIPAFLSFKLTASWGFLSWGGAFLWFFITAGRNVIQSVTGRGGFQRSPLLSWYDYVDFTRISDSLMFTGFSVPLLDYFIKTLLLKDTLSITVGTSSIAVYAIMSGVNGIYVSSHNALRGLPAGAVYGNIFRSALAIPVAVTLNAITGGFLGIIGFSGVEVILEKWAAVISKTASDSVACLIEGLADRVRFNQIRLQDYTQKFRTFFIDCEKVDLYYPNTPAKRLFSEPEKLLGNLRQEHANLEKRLVTHILDLQYFWYYQPRAQQVLDKIIPTLSHNDRELIFSAHNLLRDKDEVEELICNEISAEDTGKILKLYQRYSEEYLSEMHSIFKKNTTA